MTMQSSNLLPALQELPGGEAGQHKSFREIITGLVNMDRAMYAAEFASAASFGMWAIFDDINVDDKLFAAFEAQYTRISADQSLYEYARQKMEDGPEAWKDFINLFKGKVAEFDAEDLLASNGYSNVSLHPDPTNQGWDVSAIDPDGQEIFISVKTGGINEDSGIAEYAYDVIKEMDVYPTLDFMVGSEIYKEIDRIRPDLVDRIIADIGPEHKLVEGIKDGLNTLSDNLSIDVPDGAVDFIPYAGAIIGGVRLIVSVVKTEREFKTADRTTKNKIQVVQTLTLMSRVGVPAVLAMAGGKGGAIGGGLAGSVVPGVGNAVGGIAGGIVGTISGIGAGMYLRKRIEPKMLNLALNITGLTNDDLFYYKNKPRIDDVALNFRKTAGELAAAPAW